MKASYLLIGAASLLPQLATSAPIDKATLTEVVNNVSIIERATKKSAPAKAQQIFEAPNVLRTGADSRAEMVADDQTVTRVGQNTIFAFQQNGREIELEKGSILFQSPSGKGGGTIRTSAASAAVLGTTLIVSATSNGGFKVLLVEGKGKVTGAGGTRALNAGQMVYALPGGKLSGVFTFQLREQTSASKLIRGFKKPLPSLDKIAAAISEQERDISGGKVKATGLLAGGSPDYAYRIDAARETQLNAPANEVQVAVNPFTAAVTSDAVLKESTLDSERLFGLGFYENEFLSSPVLFDLVASAKDGSGPKPATNPAVFLGNNIIFDTPTVDLSRFATQDLVQFFSTSDTTFRQSVEFSPFNGQLFVSAGGTIRNSQPVTLTASSPLFALLAFGNAQAMTDMPSGEGDVRLDKALTVEMLNLLNKTGAIAVAGGDLNLRAFQAAAPRNIGIRSSGTLLIDRAQTVGDVPLLTLLTEDGILPPGYSNIGSNTAISIDGSGDGTIRNTSIRAPRIRISQQNLTLERVRLNDGNPAGFVASNTPMPTAATVRLNATNLLSLSGIRFSANDIYMQARTISLADMNFRSGSRVWLESQIGTLASSPNTNAPVEPGKVNFIRNVRYGGNQINSPSDPSILQNGLPASGATPQGPGIVIRPRR
jgi:hypothetical protein